MVLILNMNFDTVLDKNYGMKLLQLIADPVWVLPISQFPTNTTIRGYYSSTSKKSFPQEPVFCLETTTLSGWFSKSNNWKICFKPQKVDKRFIFFDQWFGLKQPSIVLTKSCSENMQQIYRTAPMPNCDLNKIAKQHL